MRPLVILGFISCALACQSITAWFSDTKSYVHQYSIQPYPIGDYYWIMFQEFEAVITSVRFSLPNINTTATINNGNSLVTYTFTFTDDDSDGKYTTSGLELAGFYFVYNSGMTPNYYLACWNCQTYVMDSSDVC